jgi:hypothetical protein
MSQSPESLPSKLANAPFDDLRADLVLHSSDGVNFRVFKVILSLASSVFADMFTLPLPPAYQSSTNEPQVVLLPEDAQTLDLALRYCYPIPSPEVVTLRDARILLEFARKYQADVIKHPLTRFLTDTIERDPVGIYALASAYEYQDIARKALRSSLRLPMYLLQSPGLQHITAVQYQALVHYHISCGRVASAVSMRRKWIPAEGKLATTSARGNGVCSACIMRDSVQPDRFIRYGPQYLWNYLHRSALVLAYHPNADAVTKEAFVLKDMMKCHACTTNKRLEMLECSHAFAAEIRRVVEQVPLPTVEDEGNINDIVLALLSESDKLDLQVPPPSSDSDSE